MDFNGIPLFAAMKAKLSYHSERQNVLAQNIANADTPDYRARDLAAPDFKRMVGAASHKLPLTVTNPQHVSLSSGAAAGFETIKRKSTYEQSPVGNNVAVEEEMMRIAENQSEYQKTLNLYRKTVTMFRTALGTGQGG